MKLDTGIVDIRGKQYETVALRVHKFRDAHPKHRLTTTIVHRDSQCVVMAASISDPDGNIVATGHAEEYRASSTINKTSALENCETSAIGRALAAFGLGGTEFASADEVSRAVSGQKQAFGVAADVMETSGGLPENVKNRLIDLCTVINDQYSAYGAQGAYEIIDGEQLGDMEKIFLASQMPSAMRNAIKAYSHSFHKA